MSAEDYARIVVAEAVKAKPRATLWAGTAAAVTWFVVTFLPDSVMVSALAILFGNFEIRFTLEHCLGENVRVLEVGRTGQKCRGQKACVAVCSGSRSWPHRSKVLRMKSMCSCMLGFAGHSLVTLTDNIPPSFSI
jgi:hypothetical protein